MKRILTFLLAAALLLTSLSCALADGTADDDGNVTYVISGARSPAIS